MAARHGGGLPRPERGCPSRSAWTIRRVPGRFQGMRSGEVAAGEDTRAPKMSVRNYCLPKHFHRFRVEFMNIDRLHNPWSVIYQASTNTTMKFTSILLGLALIYTTCNGQDALFRQQIVGTWTNDVATGTWTFASDSGFVHTEKSDTNLFAGTWQIKDGVLNTTITNAAKLYGISMIGATSRSKIISIDAHRFISEARGTTVTLSR